MLIGTLKFFYRWITLPLYLCYSIFCCVQYVYSFIVVCIQEHRAEKKLQRQIQEDLKNNVMTYDEYVQKAMELDKLNGMDLWKRINESTLYDYEQIENRLFQLKSFLNKEDKESVLEMLMQLRSISNRNIFGISHSQLYTCQIGTKHLIEEFIDEFCNVLRYIAVTDFSQNQKPLSELDKLQFFKETALVMGRTALMLSGGASLGMYHFGVIKALYEQNLLPRIISGSSAGAIVASIFCCKPESEYKKIFESQYFKLDAFEKLDQHKSPIRKFLRFLKNGVFMDSSRLEECLRENIGDLTFAEAYTISGRILNITVNSSKGFVMPNLLNYVSAPNVLVWSAAMCSCAVPGIFSPGKLFCKDEKGNIIPYHPSGVKFNDGTFWADLPAARLSEMFHVNFTICSQVNPHVIPFMPNEEQPGVAEAGRMFILGELKYRIQQLYQYGLVPKFLNLFETIVSQDYSGDITILPAGPLTLDVLSKLLKNPSWEYIQQCIKLAERRTWPKISVIKSRCKIEMAIDQCIEIVQRNILKKMSSYRIGDGDSYALFLTHLFKSIPIVSKPIKDLMVSDTPSLPTNQKSIENITIEHEE